MIGSEDASRPEQAATVSLGTICREWTRIGCIGFGGPPTHIALLRRLCVEERHWLPPGVRRRHRRHQPPAGPRLDPAGDLLRLAPSWGCWRCRGRVVFHLAWPDPHPGPLGRLLGQPPARLDRRSRRWAGAAVPAVALKAASRLIPASWQRIGTRRPERARWLVYALVGGGAAATIGPYLVLVFVGCGLAEIVIRQRPGRRRRTRPAPSFPPSSGTPWRSARSGRSSGWPSRSARSPTAAASSSSRSCSTTP